MATAVLRACSAKCACPQLVDVLAAQLRKRLHHTLRNCCPHQTLPCIRACFTFIRFTHPLVGGFKTKLNRPNRQSDAGGMVYEVMMDSTGHATYIEPQYYFCE